MKDASEIGTNKVTFKSVRNIIALLFFITGLIFHISLLFRINDPVMQGWYFDVVNTPDPGAGVDFNALYTQAGNILKGKSIYKTLDELLHPSEPDPVQYDEQGDYTGPSLSSETAEDYLPPFRYLPIAALVGVPLRLFDFWTAYRIWTGFHELLVLLSLYLLWKSTADKPLALILCGMLLWFAPYYVEVFQGQYSWLQAFLILLTIYNVELGNETSAMWSFIASALWKLNTLLWIIPLWLTRRHRWIYILLIIAVVTTVPYFIMHPGDIAGFLAVNLHPDTTHTFTFGNSGLRMFIDFTLRWFDIQLQGAIPNPLVKYASPLIALVIFILTLAAVWKNRKDTVGNMLILVTAYFLIYVDVWMHHWLMLLPIVIWEYRRTRSPFVFIIWLLLALPTRFDWIGEYHMLARLPVDQVTNFPAAFLYFGQKAIPALALWVWQYRMIYKNAQK